MAKFWWERERSFSGWKGHYWTNQGLEGNPLLVRDDPQVSFDWQMGGPGGGIPDDHFSARWTRTTYLQAGTYRFSLRRWQPQVWPGYIVVLRLQL